MPNARVGTAGWTDPTLTAAGVFYPPDAGTPEARLRYYASRFPMVEVDSPYYALPTPRNSHLWVERTPADFVFDVKAHALMTGHPTEVSRLPRAIQEMLPDPQAKRVYPKDLPPEAYDLVWEVFREAMEPLAGAGKLGAILLQYPRWFVPGSRSRDEILEAKQRLGGLPVAIEFRNRSWFDRDDGERTLRFLSDNDLPFVMVDEPQGLASSVPPVSAVTSGQLAIVRLHGHRGDMWEKRGASVADKYRYLYDHKELEEWVPKVMEAAEQAERTHVVFNNCYANYGTTNAIEMTWALSETAA